MTHDGDDAEGEGGRRSRKRTRLIIIIIIIIIIIEDIYIARYLTERGDYTALYKIMSNLHMYM